MGMTYNKNKVMKDRLVQTKGPRDRQIQQQAQANPGPAVDAVLVETLQKQIELLQEQLTNRPTTGYTESQVNELVINTVKNETSHLQKKIALLEETITSLKEVIKNKDCIIEDLKSQTIDYNKLTSLITEATKKGASEDITVSDRPKMETIFVDPLEKENTMEGNIKVDAVPDNAGVKIDAKVDKLKNLLGGGLPKRVG